MKKFEKLDEYSDDDLIIIVYDENENWQNEAVEYAKFLLSQRGISNDYALKRIKEIRKEAVLFWQTELDKRKEESYSYSVLLTMCIFWYRYMLWDWYLNKNGYFKKRKQRLYAIGIGILLYSILIIESINTVDKSELQSKYAIKQISIADSITISKTDWSGTYIFFDTLNDTKNQIIWKLEIIKKDLEHKAELKLISRNDTTIIECIGLVKKDGFEIFPEKTYTLSDKMTISYYDKLFTFVRDSNLIITKWDKLKPFYHQKNDYQGIFKKSKSS